MMGNKSSLYMPWDVFLTIVFIVLTFFFIKENMTPFNEFIRLFSEVMMPVYIKVFAKCVFFNLYS